MEVFTLGPDLADQAKETLAQAFLNETATDYFFPPEEGGKLEKLRALFGWAVEYRMRTGLPVLGVRSPSPFSGGEVGEGDEGSGISLPNPSLISPSSNQERGPETSTLLPPSSFGEGGGGVLAGVATLRIPKMPDLAEAEAMWRKVADFIGPAAEARMERYEAAQQRHRPSVPHHYLVAIGVHPDFQGLGFGSRLIREAIALAEADPDSQGIGLDTGSNSNQALYERFGFAVTATEGLGGKVARFMFRPNG